MSDIEKKSMQGASAADLVYYDNLRKISQAGVTIVVGRQFGCGGRRLGQFLASELDIPYFDKELLATAASRLGLNPEILERVDERRPSLIRSIFTVVSGAAGADYSVSSMNTETLYGAQADIIRQVGAEGPCVFVGRTADYILRDNPKMFSIFCHAALDWRTHIICARTPGCDALHAKNLALKQDRLRREYYNYFTGRNWGAADNYDLCLDTSRLSIEAVAGIIVNYVATRL